MADLVVELKTPEEFFGVKPGSDRTMLRWDRIAEYFWHMASASDRVKVEEAGKSTEGNPMLVAYISSPKNLARLEKIREESWRVSHPRGLDDAEAEKIVKRGKVVVGMTMSLHASEVGGTQVSPEFVYELITGEDELSRRIRDDVVLVFYPCANPDGQVMTTDFYNKYLGTEFEGGGLPWLYHKYTGHDNNRDALTLTQVETRIMNKTYVKEWFPQAYLDTHQMGFYGARFYVPPNSNPLYDLVDPTVWTEQRHYGAEMLIRLESAGISGVESASSYPADFMPGFSLAWLPLGICGMFTETASVKVATPVYSHYHQMQGSQRGRPEYKPQVNFINPWKGGWWTLRNIMDGQKAACLATLEVAANHREMILGNMLAKAKRAIKAGASEAPYAYVLPPGQWDPNTTQRLIQTLRDLSVEVHQAEKPFQAGDATYPAGSFVVMLSQPARFMAMSLLDRSIYRDNMWVRNTDGTPMMNYDFATQTMSEFKGATVVRCETPVHGKFRRLEEVPLPEAAVEEGKHGWLLDGRINDSFKAANLLLAKGIKLHRVDEPVCVAGVDAPAGCWYVPAKKGVEKHLREAAEAARVTFHALPEAPAFKSHEARKLRVAVYQRYMGGNMDEGWTRWLLEKFGFEYETIRDAEVKAGLKDKYDVLVLPSDGAPYITGEKLEEYFEKRWRGAMTLPKYPPEYVSGIKSEGVAKVKEFVEAGGTLLCLNEAVDFAIDQLKVPVNNPVKELKPEKFHCPGSTLWANINNADPLAYGMPAKGLIVLRGNLALTVRSGSDNHLYKTVVTYPEERIMQSGWLIGEEHLARRAAMVEAKVKEGRVILYAFAPQSRALTDATFKLFFNALVA